MKKNTIITIIVVAIAIAVAAIVFFALSSKDKASPENDIWGVESGVESTEEINLAGDTWEVEIIGGELGDYTYNITFLDSKTLVCDDDDFEGTYEILDDKKMKLSTDWADATHTREVYNYEIIDKTNKKMQLSK